MKDILNIYKPYMKETIIYKFIARLVGAIVFLLVWNKLSNVKDIYMVMDRGFFAIGFILLTMTWFNYLKLDGMKIFPSKKENISKESFNKTFKTDAEREFEIIHNMTEYNIESSQALEEDEELFAKLSASLLAGVCFLVASVLFMVIR